MKTDIKSIDWQCGYCNERGQRWSDAIQTSLYRRLRYTELQGLRSLPFCSEIQCARIVALRKLVVRDNRVAYEMARQERINNQLLGA